MRVVGWTMMASKAEHARRTIAKLEAQLISATDPQTRQSIEACLARWRQYLASYTSRALDAVQEREWGGHS